VTAGRGTKQESYADFVRMFADQPDALKTARPDAVPALVKVRPNGGASASALADTPHRAVAAAGGDPPPHPR
jgi:hypothetical protein